jgi:hypothetical protein
VEEAKGTMITAQRGKYKITRNVSHVKVYVNGRNERFGNNNG